MKRFQKNFPAILVWLACGLLCAPSAMALPITIDGHMDDWDITAWTGFITFDTVAAPVIGEQNGVFYWEEDGVGTGGYANASGWVEPGYGGQGYDIEAFYVTLDSSSLYIAVISGGQNLSDIGIDVNNDGTYEYGIDTSTGYLYSDLTSSDWTLVPYSQHSLSNPADILTSGKTYVDLTYFYGIGLGTVAGHANSLNRYVFETMISFSDISWDRLVDFHVTQWCGNDVANLSVHTPEPATMILFGTGLLALGSFVRHARKKRLSD